MHLASTGDSRPRASASSSSANRAAYPDGHGAHHAAALIHAHEALVDDIKRLGRLPKRNKGTSADDRADSKLAQR